MFVVSSKSGGTVETLSHFEYFWDQTGGAASSSSRSPTPAARCRSSPPSTGSRACSPTTRTSAGATASCRTSGWCRPRWPASTSVALLESAAVAEQACHSFDSTSNSGLWLGCALGELSLRGRDKLTFVVDEPIASFGLWAEQLVAESTGKEGRGVLPVADEPLGAPEVYGDDRVFVHLRNGDDARRGQREGRHRAGRGRPSRADHADHRRARRPRAGVLLRRVRHRGRGLGAGHQPVRPAQRAGGQGQHQARARGGR